MASDQGARDEATEQEFIQELKAWDVPVSPGARLDYAKLAENWQKVDYHDGSPGRGVRIAAVSLRSDDEDMIAEAAAWGNEKKVGQKGIMVLTHINHKKAVIGRLKEVGFRPIQSDNLEAPNGAMLYVRTSGDMMSGIAVDRLWIHPDCPPRVSETLTPCLRKYD